MQREPFHALEIAELREAHHLTGSSGLESRLCLFGGDGLQLAQRQVAVPIGVEGVETGLSGIGISYGDARFHVGLCGMYWNEVVHIAHV